MKIALHGNDKIDLQTYIEREGSDPRLWKIKPRCPECGEEVHAFNIKAAAAGFREVGHELSMRGRQTPGFDHKDHISEDCPFSHRNDPRFAALRDLEIDSRVRERNRDVLMTPYIRLMNGAVLNVLINELTGQTIPREHREAIWKKGEKWLLGAAAIASHPWIMPYALALLQDKAPRHFRTGGKGFVQHRAKGVQILPYVRFDGEAGKLSLPQALELNWVNDINGRMHYKPFLRKNEPVVFEVSEEAANKLAVTPKPYGASDHTHFSLG